MAARRRAVPRPVWAAAAGGLVVLAVTVAVGPTAVVGLLAILAGSSGFVPQTVVAVPRGRPLGPVHHHLPAHRPVERHLGGLRPRRGRSVPGGAHRLILPCTLIIAARIHVTGRRAPVLLAVE